MQNIHPLHDKPLQFVEFAGETPVRLIDVGAHIRTAHRARTLRELYEFAKRERSYRIPAENIKHGRDLDAALADWGARVLERGLCRHSEAVLEALFAMTKDPQVELALSFWMDGRYGSE